MLEPETALGWERKRRTADAWVAWLREFRWDWWATPSWRYPVTPERAKEAVEAWLAPFPKAYAAFGVQRGPLGDRLHVHAVVGGTGRHPDVETRLRCSWRRGNLDLVGFSPAKGAVEYLVRQTDDVELVGIEHLVPYKPRRR